MNKLLLTLLSLTLVVTAFAGEEKKDKPKKEKKAKAPKIKEEGMYALFNTSKGFIVCKLEFEKTPMTVANFVGLAEGNFTVDTNNYNSPFYNGVKFHRVIADFMIQGGDPKGNGSGGPNHRMFDETREDLKHSGPGILSMANSDPQGSKQRYSNTGRTNGSQFFITHKATPHLDGLHTVFGHVVKGQSVVNKIAQDDVMIEVTIIRNGKAAKAFDATATYKQAEYDLTPEGMVDLVKRNTASIATKEKEVEELKAEKAAQKKEKKKAKLDNQINALEKEIEDMKTKNAQVEQKIAENKKLAEEKARIEKIAAMSTEEYNKFFLAEIQKKFPNAKQTASGLVYVLDSEGDSTKITPGAEVEAHCTGNFRKDGSKFFSTKDGPGNPMKFRYKMDRMVPGWEEGLAMLGAGGKGKFFLPYHLAYGARGRGGAIPPYSDLIFTTEVMKVAAPTEHHEGDGHDHSGHDHSGHDHSGHNHKH